MERNEALERLREVYADAGADTKAALEALIPGLAESEDERIRKDIVGLVSIRANDCDKERMLAWLEKQKEQKPELPLMNGDADLYFDEWRQHYQGSPTKRECFEEGMRYAQRLQKPVDWSEEDEKRVKQLIYDTEHIRAEYEKRKKELGERFNDKLIKDCDEQIAWLKSLRPQPHWKPSEEQMGTLRHAIIFFSEMQDVDDLESLYDDLKKL